jgi:hypothetical protein
MPEDWAFLTELKFVNLSRNLLAGYVLILDAAERLEGLELSDNNLSRFPKEYFSEDRFHKLEFVNVNFNSEIVMPEECIRQAFCFKKTLIYKQQGNDLPKVSLDLS